jgi:hypothetical protein
LVKEIADVMEVLELMCVPKAADGVEEGEKVGFLLLGTVMVDVGFVEASGEETPPPPAACDGGSGAGVPDFSDFNVVELELLLVLFVLLILPTRSFF